MGLIQYEGRPEPDKSVVFLTGTATIRTGAMVYYISAADPNDSTFAGKEVGAIVENSPTTHIPPKFAGVVHEDSDGTVAPAFVVIQKPRLGDVLTVQVAVGIDVGDGGVLTDAQDFLADGGAHAIAADEFFVLYDEDHANNPHTASAISASAGLVEAVYTGVNRST